MSPSVPGPYALALLGLAVFRLWKLLAEDAVLDRPRAWLLNLGDWEEGKPVPTSYRASFGDMVRCPWCLGWHLGLIWWLVWLWQPEWALWAAVPLALSAVVGTLATFVGLAADTRDGS